MKRVLVMAYCICTIAAIELRATGKPLLEKPQPKEMARTNPYATRNGAEQAGKKLFQRECASCHGQQGGGTARAPSLVSPVLKQTSEGAIFWVLRHGYLRRGMPSFSHLPEPQRWQIITYLKSLQ